MLYFAGILYLFWIWCLKWLPVFVKCGEWSKWKIANWHWQKAILEYRTLFSDRCHDKDWTLLPRGTNYLTLCLQISLHFRLSSNHKIALAPDFQFIVLHAATTPFVFFLCLSYKINIKHLSGRICATICGDLLLSNFIFIKLPDIKNEGGIYIGPTYM